MAKRENYDSDVTITGTSSADTIHNNGANNVSISAGAGDDYITVEGGHNVTVSGGAGNDYVNREWGVGIAYVYTSGNDTLENFHDSASLIIADKWSSVRTDDSTVLITVKNKGTITLTEAYLLPKIVSSIKDVKHYNLMWNDGNRTFTGTSGDDYMWNEGNRVKVNGLAGDDYIETNNSQVTIDAGAGDDFVGSWRGSNNLIKLGAGNDIFQAGTGNYTVDGGTGNDTIRTWDETPNISVNGGEGDDYFHNNAYEATIDGGDGNDSIGNWGENAHNVSISSGVGNDTIGNNGKDCTIDGGDGNDYIGNNGKDCTIDGGDGNDSIGNWGENAHNVSISSGVGNDTIGNNGKDCTIDGGNGDDTIGNRGNNASISAGDGNDIIDSWSTKNTAILGGAGDDTINNWDNAFLTVDAGDGNDYIRSDNVTGSHLSIEGGKGNDVIINQSGAYWDENTQCWISYYTPPNYSTLSGGDDDDSIENYGSYVSISGGAGNDYVYNNANNGGGDNVTIMVGEGDDTVLNYNGFNTSINAGSGNDFIENYGFNATIMGGKGNDTVWNNEAGMVYVYKPGEGNDYISGFGTLETLVVDGAKFTTVKSGSDVLVNVGKNTITLEGAASLAKVNIATSTKGIVPVNVVNNYESDVAVNGMVSSNWIRNYADKVTINSGSSTDDIYNSGSNVTIKGGGGYDQIRSYASDVSIQGGSKVDKIISGNGDNVSIDAGKGNDVIDAYDGVNLFIRGGKGNDTINLSRAHGIFTYTKGDGNDVISKGAIINLIDSAKINETITSGSDTVLKIGTGSITVKDSKPEEITVVKNNKYSAYLVNVLHNKVQGKVIGKSSATATQKISNYGEAGTIIGGKGIDSIYNEASNSSINAGADDDYLQIGDYNISGVTALGGAGNDTIYNNGKKTSIDAGTGNDTIISEGNSENVTIDGGKGHDVIEVQGLDYVVRGGKGNDSINLSLGRNNTEYVFEYADGDGNDVLSKGAVISLLDGAKISQSLMSGSDSVFKIGTGSITVKDSDLSNVEFVQGGNYEKYFGYDEVSNTTPGQIVNFGTSVHRKSRIQNDADNVTIQSGDHSDTINSWGHNVLINAGNGNNYIYSYSTNGTIITGSDDDSVYTTNNDNDKNYIDLGGGANYIYNNGTNTTIKSNSTIGNTIYTCPNSENNLIICGDAPNRVEVNGLNPTVNCGKKDDIITNNVHGDPIKYNEEVVATIDKIKYLQKIFYEKYKEEFLKACDENEVLKDILEKGSESEYLQALEKDARKFVSNFVTALRDTIKLGNDFNSAENFFFGTINNLDTLKEIFVPTIDWDEFHVALNRYSEAKRKLDDEISDLGAKHSWEKYMERLKEYNDHSDSPEINQFMQSGIDKLKKIKDSNESFWNKLKKAYDVLEKIKNNAPFKKLTESLGKIGMGLGVLALTLDIIDDWDNINKAWKTVATSDENLLNKWAEFNIELAALDGDKYDNIILDLWGVAPALPYGINSLARTSYLKLQHEDADFWKTFAKQFNPFDFSKGNYVPKSLNMIIESAEEPSIAKLIGGAGNDSIVNNEREQVSISGGDGNDTIANYTSNNVTIRGGTGNNELVNFVSDNVEIIGGKKNDFIYNLGDYVNIETGKGNNSVDNFNSFNVSIRAENGNDYIDNIGSFNSIEITGGNNMINSMGLLVSINTGAGNDTIENVGDSVKVYSGAGDDYIVNEAGNFVTINTAGGNDSIINDGVSSNVSIVAGKGADYIENFGKANQIDCGASDDVINNFGNSNSITLCSGNDYMENFGTKNSIYGGTGEDIIVNLGDNNLISGNEDDDIIFNEGANVQFKYAKGDGNDYIYGFNDTSTISIGNGKGTYSTATLSEDVIVTVGKSKISLVGAASLSALNINGTDIMSLTLTNDSAAKVTLESPIKTANASSRTSAIRIVGNAFNNSIVGGSKNDSLYGGNGNDYLSGEQGNDKIYGQNGADSLLGGSGNDTLTGGKDNDFFIYNAGNDVIADFTAGQDKIQIASGKISKTSLSGSDVLFTIGKGSLTVKNAKGKTISLLDSTGKASSTVVGAQALTNSNKANVTIGADMGFVDASKRTKAILITGNALANSISGGTKNDSIFGAAGNDSIIGNAGNDKLYGDAGNDILLGGKGNDSLWGGVGNDSLWGDAGNDTFIYTVNEGTDKIFDYADGDMLKILNVDGSDGYFKSSKYSGGDLTLTINGGGKIIFDDVASTTKFNINGSSYNISGSKLVKK